MSPRSASRVAWLLFAVTVAAFVVAIAVSAADAAPDGSAANFAVFALFVLAFAVVGALLVSRRPGNPLGWIMCLAGLAYALTALGDRYAQSYIQNPNDGLPGAAAGLWLSNWGWMAGIGPAATFLMLLFPTGRLPSPRWRPVAWIAGAGLALGLPGLAFRAGRYEGYMIENPAGVPGASVAAGIGLPLLAIATIASIASLFARYRRAGFQERQQLKWLIYAAVVIMLAIAAVFGLEAAGLNPSDDLTNGLVTGSVAAVPVAIGIAILRHRLYDIDVVINRTVVYGALTLTLAAAYLGSVLLLQLLLSPESDFAIAGSTLSVAALVRPARWRIQALVDRRFFRRKYDAAQTLESFGGRLRNEVDLDALGGELRTVVGETMQPAHMSLWLKAGG